MVQVRHSAFTNTVCHVCHRLSAVDTLVKLAPEYKELYSDEQMHAFLLSLQSRIDDVDAMRREFAEDPRVIVVDRQLFRLRDVCIDLKTTPVVAEYNSRLHECETNVLCHEIITVFVGPP
ncbi:hypothetical protein AaE_001015 [Aphanomyces astaci]|uniref:Uncharacterized protein n=1 Tax=Aphanomyces astaci TaxID=112090 RepID=A0A6A5ASU1_APHAT|nr:hypothetical protein AaE_001015 [Aphanomyces astaci]